MSPLVFAIGGGNARPLRISESITFESAGVPTGLRRPTFARAAA
ncbi:MAG TPA: hypothetical protein VHC91_15350 [Trinickia sp.]|nr:hypothetical protein [Trinickia sp.]HVW51748.1 hypothetical protein [Trinickia sp.]